jgi:hypothetical protein
LVEPDELVSRASGNGRVTDSEQMVDGPSLGTAARMPTFTATIDLTASATAAWQAGNVTPDRSV